MATQEQLDRIDRFLSTQQASIRQVILQFIADVNDDAVVKEIERLIRKNQIEAAIEIVDSHIRAVPAKYPSLITDAGEFMMDELKAAQPKLVMGVAFEAAHPLAAAAIRVATLEAIVQIVDSQRAAIRQAMSRGFMEGLGFEAMSRLFRGAIGLTAAQERAVNNYEVLLRKGTLEALTRTLRDRRFDRTVERAALTGRPLSEEQIRRMVDRYRERFVAHRAATIARTEGLKVTSLGRQLATEQMIRQLGIAPERIIRRWNSTHDKRVRDFHLSMDQDDATLNGMFTDGLGNKLKWPGDPDAPPETIINCRCTVTVEVKPPRANS